MNVYQKTENQNLAINAAKAIGCQVTNIGAADLIEARPILVLGLVWQIIKIQLLSSISLKNFPELVLLLEEGEDLDALLKLPPEEILLRWFNYHLKNANHHRRVHNFGKDLQDSENYSVLLHQLAPSQCDLCTEPDLEQRAAHVINNARRIGVNAFIHPQDIVKANKKLNLGFVAQLFNTMPGLHITQEQLAEYDFATLDLDDAGDSREERVFRMWINSLNIDGLYINDLFADLQDGVALLKVMDRVQPGVVTWKRVNMNPTSKFKKVENANYAVVLGKQMNFVLVNVGGVDIVDKNKKLILAIIWQLMRRYTIDMLTQLGSEAGREITDDDIVAWANRRVQGAGKTSRMNSFRDSSLSNGRFLIDLCAALEPRAVNWELVTDGSNNADALNNAKYAISIARKLGACVFLTPEDVTEVKSKMIMTFVASLWVTDLENQRSGERK
jgi:plastin-1